MPSAKFGTEIFLAKDVKDHTEKGCEGKLESGDRGSDFGKLPKTEAMLAWSGDKITQEEIDRDGEIAALSALPVETGEEDEDVAYRSSIQGTEGGSGE